MKSKIGYLKIIIGPMGCGKTTELIREISRIPVCTDPNRFHGVYINSSIDTRSSDVSFSSHSPILNRATLPQSCTAIKTKNLIDVLPKINELLKKYENLSIFIDEAQWFNDLQIMIIRLLELNLTVTVAGLDSDYLQQPFGKIQEIIPYSNAVIKLTSLCYFCAENGIEREAPLTIKIQGSKEINDPGGMEKYKPVCFLHKKEHGIDFES